MINRFFIFIFFLFSGSVGYAQNCITQYEQIFDLKAPTMGALSVWGAGYGADSTHEGFQSAVVLGDGHVVVVGTMERKTDTVFGPFISKKKLVFVEFDRRGRVVWEAQTSLKNLVRVEKMLPHEDGYVVLTTFKEGRDISKPALIFAGARGKVLRQTVIESGDGLSIIPRDIERRWGDEGYVFVATGTDKSRAISHSLLYTLDNKGRVLDKKAFRTGLNNILLSVQRSDERFYIVTGQAEDPKYRQNGWVMKLSRGADIVWQMQYARGNAARLMKAADFPGQRMVVVGQVLSVADGGSGAWVMMLDRVNGNTLWQRFYRSGAHNVAEEVVVEQDDLMTVLMNTKPREGGKMFQGHVARVLTINPRGVLFIGDDYFNGEGLVVGQMIEGQKGERVMVGTSQVVFDVEQGRDHNGDAVIVKDRSQQGWLAVMPAPEPYNDPCKPFALKIQPVLEENHLIKDVEAVFP